MYNPKHRNNEEDFHVDIVDLPSDERRNAEGIFNRFWDRLLSIIPAIHVTLEIPEEQDYDECDFSYRVYDLPDSEDASGEEKRVLNW